MLADLGRHDVILVRSGVDRWELTGPHGVESVLVTGIVAADHLGFVVDATLAGLGIALLPAFCTSAHLTSGALVQVLPKFSTTIQLQLLTHATRHLPHRVALLRDFLAQHLSGACRAHATR